MIDPMIDPDVDYVKILWLIRCNLNADHVKILWLILTRHVDQHVVYVLRELLC